MKPTSISELQSFIRSYPQVLPRGGGTKTALSSPHEGATPIDLSALSGVIEYEPGEFVFTAYAGTRLSDIQAVLSEHGQYLPFDPLLVERGATLGGAVASGLSGPGRYRYGGVRDFLLGVRFVNAAGEIVHAGGKVVKNAAGFDIPKLMVGSLGQLGVLTELSFKVFPQPEAYATLRADFTGLPAAVEALYRLTTSPLDMEALDIEATSQGAILWVRIAGLRSALAARLDRLRALIGQGDVVEAETEAVLWHDTRELTWLPAGWALIKAPITPKRIVDLDQGLAGIAALRRYSGGGQVAWLATPEPIAAIDEMLARQNLAGLVVIGEVPDPLIGARRNHIFAQRVKGALDPQGRFNQAL